MTKLEEAAKPAVPREVIIQRQIVITAALVAIALMLREVLELIWSAQDPHFSGVAMERWISVLLFAGLGYLSWQGIERPSWIKVTWILIATIYFTVWSCWALVTKPQDIQAAKPSKVQLTIPPRPTPPISKLSREHFVQ